MNLKKIRQLFSTIPSFKKYQLKQELNSYLQSWNYNTPTAVQDLAIPHLIKNEKDFYFIAGQTGQGKTLAYLLPIFQSLQQENKNQPNRPRVVILVPSKELVSQICFVLRGFYKYFNMKIVGLTSYQTIGRQGQLMQEGVDFVVSTLDRFEKHIEKNNIYLSQLKYLIIDEADTQVDAGFKKEIENYINIIKNKNKHHEIKSKIIFVGATYTGPLSNFFLYNFGPSEKQLQVNMKKLIEKNTHLNLHNISHEFIQLGQLDKLEPLMKLLQEEIPKMNAQNGSMMIFTNSISCCQALEYKIIENGLSCVSLHGDVPMKAREQNFKRFRDREVNIMLSTDLGSRGLDFDFLTHVINFDFPVTNSDYLHRAGRTGRAGKVISLYHQKDMPNIRTLQEAHDSNSPIDIKGSSYSKINKEILVRQKEMVKNGENLEEYQQQIDLAKINLKESQERNSLNQEEKPKGYIPERNKFEQGLKKYRKILGNTKKYQRNQQQNKIRQIKFSMRRINRQQQREKLKKEKTFN